jgi:hypothetical protein
VRSCDLSEQKCYSVNDGSAAVGYAPKKATAGSHRAMSDNLITAHDPVYQADWAIGSKAHRSGVVCRLPEGNVGKGLERGLRP